MPSLFFSDRLRSTISPNDGCPWLVLLFSPLRSYFFFLAFFRSSESADDDGGKKRHLRNVEFRATTQAGPVRTRTRRSLSARDPPQAAVRDGLCDLKIIRLSLQHGYFVIYISRPREQSGEVVDCIAPLFSFAGAITKQAAARQKMRARHFWRVLISRLFFGCDFSFRILPHSNPFSHTNRSTGEH